MLNMRERSMAVNSRCQLDWEKCEAGMIVLKAMRGNGKLRMMVKNANHPFKHCGDNFVAPLIDAFDHAITSIFTSTE